jgi:hypothetical protein
MTEQELSQLQGEEHLCPDCRHWSVCCVPKVLGKLSPGWYTAISCCAHFSARPQPSIKAEDVIK